MRSPDGTPLISIGITYRKDVYPYVQLRTMEQFLECVGREHEVIEELVRSGTVVDTNFYSSYMWECRQHYSPDRWYILGDAGDTVDPLYSVGMALSSVQIRQIGAIVERELNGHEVREFAKDLDTAISTLHHSLTRDTTQLYQCMGDAYQCHLRVHLVVTELFHLGLPLLMNGYLWDPVGVKIFNRFATLKSLEADAKNFQDLIQEVALDPKNRELGNFIKVQSSASMNNSFYEYHRERDIPASLSRLFFGYARLRLSLLAKLGWQGCLRFRQQCALLKDIFRGLCLLPFRGRILRENAVVRWLISPRKVSAAPVKSLPDPRPPRLVSIRASSAARASAASVPSPQARSTSSQLSR
jgi:hypothetical protein